MKFIGLFIKFKTIFLVLLVLSSCLPKHEVREPLSAQNNSTSNNSSEDTDNNPLTLPQQTNFLQLGQTTSSTALSLFSNYKDSFLIRGNQLISFLFERTKSTQTNLCLVANYQGASGTGALNLVIMSARVRSFYNSQIQAKEYFLQIEPNNKSINQNDCLTVSLTNKLQSIYGTSSFALTLEEVCPSCKVNINSDSLRLFDPNGTEETTGSDISYLYLNLIPAAGNDPASSPVCTINASCTSIGFNCCLKGQCVNHGDVKEGIDQSSTPYKTALEVILNKPEQIKNYEEYFYICPQMVPIDTDDSGSDTIDPVQEASDLFTELNRLYNCTTPVQDEFSICTNNYADASELMGTSAYTFSAANDDITFSSIANTSSLNNIVEINYAGQILFKEQILDTDIATAAVSGVTLNSSNDSLLAPQTVSILATLPANAVNDLMSISYRVDGTCEKLGSSLARCKKYYTQGQSSTPPRSSDHAAGDNTFALPSYADITFNIIVEVGGSTIPQGSDTWALSGRNVVFNGTQFPIYTGQEVTITYFVSNNVSQLTASKEAAQDQIDDHCRCDPNEPDCRLEPQTTELNGSDVVTSYICIYPEPDTPPVPLQKTVFVSTKSVPQKFYDTFGVNYDLGSGESSENAQEGNLFEYERGSNFRPNNESAYVGFNEIYGSQNVDGASPLPPVMIEVEKGKSYDIFVDTGAFSTCLSCGVDYYSNLQKIFPNNFSKKAAGYFPDAIESRKRTNQGDYPADDFRFGRACFVPATMIPWTHVANADLDTQRQNRMRAQHFLFANGYNKDWYGFDYGALIGSYDGITWFAIGNQRRTTADSNKLYLAVNAYFGDLTINNSYQVTVNEMAPVLNSGSFVDHDTESDGAECQKMHYCSKDEDCIAQLGYDYSCENVGSLMTPWPLFSSNGEEISGNNTRSILSLVGGSNGQINRCVYRGVGAICERQNQSVVAADSYTLSDNVALHTCSPNSLCTSLNDTNHNSKIARYGGSPANQNIQSFITDKTDTFGLKSRILGRPFEYYGTESADSTVRVQFSSTNVNAICQPGKDVENATSLQELNYFNTTTFREADVVNNVGRTMSSLTFDTNYFAACPATDDDGEFTHYQNVLSSDTGHNPFAIRNNMSTNSLQLSGLTSQNLFNDDDGPLVTQIGYHKNACLRAPGAKCFADFECSPNSFISSRVKSVSDLSSFMSAAEESFWEEELVCANSQERYLQAPNIPNPVYETFEHKCCRETGNDFTYFSQPHINNTFTVVQDAPNGDFTPLVPGFNQDITDIERYSRTHTVYDKLISEPTKYPPMVKADPRPATPFVARPIGSAWDILRQYNTLHLNNSRMCCTGHWVRKLSEGTNSNAGATRFNGTVGQQINIDILRPLSWNENTDDLGTLPGAPATNPFICELDEYLTSECEIRNMPEGSSYEQKYLTWLSKFELLGIPQVLIETNTDVQKPISTDVLDTDGDTIDDTDAQMDITLLNYPLDSTIKDVTRDTDGDGFIDGIADVQVDGQNYYSAASYDNFEIGPGEMKRVFSEDEFKCCIPTGFEIPLGTPDTSCCSGRVANNGASTVNRCCLDDFTDLTVYTNRYVSSEGAFFNGQEIQDSDIDPTTGYIRKEIVLQMAQTMCCSGKADIGKAIGDYLVPVTSGGSVSPAPNDFKTRRFLYMSDLDSADAVDGGAVNFSLGLKWNNHVYCVPEEFESSLGTGGSGSGSVQE